MGLDVARDPDILSSHLTDASQLPGSAVGLARCASVDDVREALSWARDRRVGVTTQGLLSGLAGGAVPDGTLAIDTRGLSGVVDLDPARRRVRVRAGTVLADLKAEVAAAGLFYGPDPTSEGECSVGGSIATNASGARSLRYGATAAWVEALTVVKANGDIATLARGGAEKAATFQPPLVDPVAQVVGSEGRLCVIVEAELRLERPPERVSAMVVLFAEGALELRLLPFVEMARAHTAPPGLRTCELFDATALDIVKEASAQSGRGVRLPAGAKAALYLEIATDDDVHDDVVERWFAIVAEGSSLANDTLVLSTSAELNAFRALRHAVPATLNERAARAKANGGGKVSTDWAVPRSRLAEMIPWADRRASELATRIPGLAWLRFGHIGNGHPHYNLLAPDAEARVEAKRVGEDMARQAVALGGVVSAEHGVGRIKRALAWELLPLESQLLLDALERAWDPAGLFRRA